jgi:hypothetical protein
MNKKETTEIDYPPGVTSNIDRHLEQPATRSPDSLEHPPTEPQPQRSEPRPDLGNHDCEYDSDGAPCNLCGVTASQAIRYFERNLHEQPPATDDNCYVEYLALSKEWNFKELIREFEQLRAARPSPSTDDTQRLNALENCNHIALKGETVKVFKFSPSNSQTLTVLEGRSIREVADDLLNKKPTVPATDEPLPLSEGGGMGMNPSEINRSNQATDDKQWTVKLDSNQLDPEHDYGWIVCGAKKISHRMRLFGLSGIIAAHNAAFAAERQKHEKELVFTVQQYEKQWEGYESALLAVRAKIKRDVAKSRNPEK